MPTPEPNPHVAAKAQEKRMAKACHGDLQAQLRDPEQRQLLKALLEMGELLQKYKVKP